MARLFILVGLALVVALSVSGCLATESGSPTTEVPNDTTTAVTTSTSASTVDTSSSSNSKATTAFGSDDGGKLFTYLVDKPPENATVIDSSDPKVEDATFVQDVLRQTVENGPVTMNINGSQLDRLDRELEDVPYTSGGKSGYYLRYDGEVIRIVIARYQ